MKSINTISKLLTSILSNSNNFHSNQCVVTNTAAQSQNVVSDCFTSMQILPFDFEFRYACNRYVSQSVASTVCSIGQQNMFKLPAVAPQIANVSALYCSTLVKFLSPLCGKIRYIISINPCSAKIDIRRQNLTLTSKVNPRAGGIKINSNGSRPIT